MPFKRTDKGKVQYPNGISSEDRRFCRKVFNEMGEYIDVDGDPNAQKELIIACSGGLDSTVLAHVFAQMCIISGLKKNRVKLVYVDHGLRNLVELHRDATHVINLAEMLGFNGEVIKVTLNEGNVQEQARIARYDALAAMAVQTSSGDYADVLLAHHANDVAETKLFQFLTGRKVTGIESNLSWYIKSEHEKDPNPLVPKCEYTIDFFRPFLNLTRSDLERYARIWNLQWVEDSTNGTNKYTRNRIRHELIPWIEKNVNPGVINTLVGLHEKEREADDT